MAKKIEKFVLSEYTNNLYKKEAGSSIALTRDLADKINELVEAFNSLENYKLEKIHEQDGKISKAIIYMKDNLLHTMDELMQILINRGVIDSKIQEHIGTLIEQVNNLLGKVENGSITSMDAEVIDGRVGYDGTTYINLGESIRKQIEGVIKASLNLVDISSYTENAFIRKSNGSIKTEAENYRISDPIEITFTKLYFKGNFHAFTDCDLINFYSSNELSEANFISSVTPTNNKEMNKISIPEGATHFAVCTSTTYYDQTQLYFGGENLKLKQQEELSLIPIDLKVEIQDKFIRGNGSSVDSTGMVISEPIEITNSKVYIKGNNKKYSSTELLHFYSNTEVSFYGYIGSYHPVSSELEEVIIPEGTKYIRVCTGSAQFDSTKVYFNNYPKTKELKRINEITSKLVNSDRKIKVKLIGDSIVCGLRGTGYEQNGTLIYGSNYVNENGHCWANELKSYLQSKFNCEVLNYGVNGIGSDVLLSKMSSVVAEDDDIIICAIGTNDRVIGNDAYTGNPRTLESIYKNMNGIYTYAKRLGKEIIFISPIPSSVSDDLNRNFHTEDIANLYLKLSEEKGIEIINLHSLLNEYCELKDIEVDSLLNDGLHPNDEGYDVLFRIICRKLGFNPKRKSATW